MALFPAFSGNASSSNNQVTISDSSRNKASWLQNASYEPIEVPSDESTEECVIIGESTNECSIIPERTEECVIIAEVPQKHEPAVVPSKRSRSKSPHRYHKSKKKKSSKSKRSSRDRSKTRDKQSRIQKSHTDEISDTFYEDRIRQAGNLIVSTLHRPAVPLYSRHYLMPVGTKYNSSYHSWRMSGKGGRYFLLSLKDVTVDVDEEFEKETNKDEAEQTDDISEIMNGIWRTPRLEEEVQNAKELFNSRLSENPQDVRTWLEFLRFQERAAELQFRGGRSKRALAQRKIDILEKALQENPRSWLLQREKVHLEKFLYPPDELEQKLGKEAEETNSLCTWMAYLEVLRERATTTEVTIAYGKAMEVARREGRAMQRRTGHASVSFDEKIVDLLFSCGLYMRQGGLWERLWTLIRMYLELNLKPKSTGVNETDISFDIGAQPEDAEVDHTRRHCLIDVMKQGLLVGLVHLLSRKNQLLNFGKRELEELETEVYKSGLPLSEIWLRVEGLRQSARWLPLSPSDKNEEEGDLQRLVFPEDVSELVHPLATANTPFSGIPTRLAAVALLLLKVPLLPCRDTALRRHGFPLWSCDTPEVPLTAIYSGGPWDWGKGALPFDLLGEMVAGGSGPQYLLPRPGRDLFLKSIQKLFLVLTEVGISAANQQYFGVWWLRFERWLITLEEYKSSGANFTLPPKWKKQLKSTIKEFLSRAKNRSSLALYREYALIDAALGKKEAAVQTLCTAATLGGYPVIGGRDPAEMCSIYRVLAELLLTQGIDKFLSDNQGVPSLNTPNSEGNETMSGQKTTSSDRITSSLEVHREGGNRQSFNEPQPSVGNTSNTGSLEHRESLLNPNVQSPSNNEKANLHVEGIDTKDIISLSVTNISIDATIVKQSRWDVTKPSVGTAGRRPRWTAAGVFMGTVFCDGKGNEAVPSEAVSSETVPGEALPSESKGAEVNTPNQPTKKCKKIIVKIPGQPKERESPSTSAKVNSSSYEEMTKTVLTCLGLGKPLCSLEESVCQSEVKASLQVYKNVFQEILKEELAACSSPDLHAGHCNCKQHGNKESGSGLECFQSYLLVEWVCCWAWLLSLVESAWGAGAVFEETLCKLPKISVEQMEEVEEDEDKESERNCGWSGGRYNSALVRVRNIRESVYEGYISMLLAKRWSPEGRSGLNAILADVIRRALGEFPENVCFAAAVAVTENEVGYGGSPWWSVTSYFDGGLGRAGGGSWSVFGKIFLVLLAEQRRRRVEKGIREGQLNLDMGGPVIEDFGGKNRLRSVLRHLVADSGTRSCPLLWRLYLRFVGAVEGMDDCKGVAYRGLQQCPWVKAFYLDAGRLLPEEISQFQDLITERELRLHVSPEELEILRT